MNAVTKFEAMTPFIEIDLDGEKQLGVDARSLHAVLGSKRQFSNWIKSRIEQCGFEENFDYIKLNKKVELSKTGQMAIEYVVSLDMAKHLGMLEKTPQGHEIRKYFIEQEKVSRNVMYGIQLEINKAMLKIEHVTDILSNAGRTLNVLGKQVKPQLMQTLDELMIKAQPSLPLE